MPSRPHSSDSARQLPGDAWKELHPQITVIAREARAYLKRVVRYLVDEVGIRQFLDIGTGLPTADNTHEVAQRIAPDTRVVYVDNDPLVLAHARALLHGTPEGTTEYPDSCRSRCGGPTFRARV